MSAVVFGLSVSMSAGVVRAEEPLLTPYDSSTKNEKTARQKISPNDRSASDKTTTPTTAKRSDARGPLQPYPPGYRPPPAPARGTLMQPYGAGAGTALPPPRYAPAPPPRYAPAPPPVYPQYPPYAVPPPQYSPYYGQPYYPPPSPPQYSPQQYPYYSPPNQPDYPSPNYAPPPPGYAPPPNDPPGPPPNYAPPPPNEPPYPPQGYAPPEYPPEGYAPPAPYYAPGSPPFYYAPPTNVEPGETPPPIVAPLPSVRRAPAKPTTRFLFKLSLGYGYRYVFNTSVSSAAFEMEMGADGQHVGGGMRLGFEAGQTPAGANFGTFVLGPGIEWKLGSRLRLGFSPTLSFMAMDDLVSGGTLGAVALGLWGDVSVDLVKARSGGALFLAGRIGYDFMIFSDAGESSLIARLWLGYRF